MAKSYINQTDDPDHPTSPYIGIYSAAVGAIVLNEANEVLLTQRALHNPVHPGSWEVLFGRVNQGETFEAALHREAREELGIRIEPTSIVATMRFTRTIEEPEHIGVVFLASILPNQTITIDPDEVAAYRWSTIAQALPMVNEHTRVYLDFVQSQLKTENR